MGDYESFVYCNGRKLVSFTSYNSVGSTQTTFGDVNPSGIVLDYTRATCGLKCNTDYIRNMKQDLTMQCLYFHSKINKIQ